MTTGTPWRLLVRLVTRTMAIPLLTCGTLAATIDVTRLPPPASRAVDFTRDIEPIFHETCHRCHGPEKQKSEFRLDSKEAAMRGGEHGRDIVPGRSAESPLIHYVAGLVEDRIMPPKGGRLTSEQIGLLRAWIDQGAPWPETASFKPAAPWWSLKPLVRLLVPELSQPPAPDLNPIDAFILAKLTEKGLSPSPEADRRTLARRVYFDLIGLPPTPEQIDEFVRDPDPKAYEKLVDLLLASPRYGERWARHWLDVVHYGDTHGYDKDKPRPNAWPYRDYVIRAFNEDKPYSRFVQEQVAGDVLFPDSPDGIEALGFIAAGPWDFIGHEEVPETKVDGKIARHLDRDDMVANTINTFNSLTIHCAQCHNHKFDPIPTEDYYSLQAVFAALDRADKAYDMDPAIARRRRELKSEEKEILAREKALDEQIARRGGVELVELDRRIAVAQKGAKGGKRPEFGYHSAIETQQNVAKWVQVDLGRPVSIDRIVLAPCDDDFNGIGPGFGFPARFKVEMAEDPGFDNPHLVADCTKLDCPSPGNAPQRIQAGGKVGRYVRVTATKLAPRQNDFIFALSEIEVIEAGGTNVALGSKVTALDSIEAPARWAKMNLTDGVYPAMGAVGSPATLAELNQQREQLLRRVLDDSLRQGFFEVTNSLANVRAAIAGLPKEHRVYAGTVHSGNGAFRGTGPDGGKPRVIHLLNRGDVKKPGKEVGPGALNCVAGLPARFELPFDAAEGDRRAALARWLTDARHPLTWRSIVNRVWQYHFGRGLVETPNDFGRMGRPPTHPELLDWLAVEFRDGGQSLKKLHRLIVTSATYRQVSTAAQTAASDQDNRYLWRMNRRKIEAEAVRDSVLLVSGRLDLRMYGPAFQDFIIDKPEHSPHYEYYLHDPDDPKSHRRSIYRFLVRSQQQPFMTTLDCADPSMLVDKRNESLSALQALALLNNGFMVTMAKHFAGKLEADGGSVPVQVDRGFRRALGRTPTPAEREELVGYAQRHGLANFCRVLFNLNEFSFVD